MRARGVLHGAQRPIQRMGVAAYNSGRAPDGPSSQGVYHAQFTSYGGEGAVTWIPKAAQWCLLNDGSQRLGKPGGFMTEFASRLATAEAGRRYNWENKEVFFCDPLELSAMASAPEQKHQMVHDPNKGRLDQEGRVIKTLTWLPAAGGGCTLTLRKAGTAVAAEKVVAVHLSRADVHMFVQLVNSSLAHMYGFDLAFRR